MAGPTYVTGVVQAPDNGDYHGPTVTIAKPAAVTTGDVMLVLALGYEPASAIPALPSGWANLALLENARFMAKFVQAGEASWQFGNNLEGGVLALWYRGADSDLANLVLGVAQKTTNGTTRNLASITTARANSMAVILRASDFTSGAPAGWTERFDTTPTALNRVLESSDKAFAAAGAIGALSYAAGINQTVWELLLAIQPPPAPTVTAVSPAAGTIDGGTPITITGTNFIAGATVDVGGSAATEVVVVSSTQITCVTPAHAAGAVTVTVTTTTGDGALATAFTYVSVVDSIVKLFKGGSPTGNDKASSAQWPASPAYVEYGGAADLWGATLTPDDVNAADFGVGIAAVTGTGGEARVSHVEMEVTYSVPGIQDPQTYLSVLKVDADRTEVYPAIYRLPRAGYSIANDPSMDRAISGASLWTSRIYEPARYIEKTYRCVEFYAELSPASGTPGFEVWASVDDGDFFQLLDSAGAPATLRRSGPQRVFFPASDVARGRWFQLELRVPELVGDQVPVAVALSNFAVRCNYRPERTEAQSLTLNLGTIPTHRGGSGMERRTPYQKLALLIDLAGPGKPPVQLRDALGRDVYVHIIDLDFEEVTKREAEEPALVATIRYRVAEYA
jgi:hypothetical protein